MTKMWRVTFKRGDAELSVLVRGEGMSDAIDNARDALAGFGVKTRVSDVTSTSQIY